MTASGSEDLNELNSVEEFAARTARGAFLRWCIRWAITIALFVYFLPKAPWLWWVFIPAVILGLFNLFLILRMAFGVPKRADEIRSLIEEAREIELEDRE